MYKYYISHWLVLSPCIYKDMYINVYIYIKRENHAWVSIMYISCQTPACAVTVHIHIYTYICIHIYVCRKREINVDVYTICIYIGSRQDALLLYMYSDVYTYMYIYMYKERDTCVGTTYVFTMWIASLRCYCIYMYICTHVFIYTGGETYTYVCILNIYIMFCCRLAL